MVSCQQENQSETQIPSNEEQNSSPSNDPESPTPTYDDESLPFLVDVSNESDADASLIFRDGTYMVYDKENKTNHEMVYIGSETNGNDFSKGMVVLLDENHLPKYATFNGDTFFFSNYSEDTFDLAVVFANGETQFYWDIETGVLVEDFLESLSTETKASGMTNFWLGFAAKTISFASLGAVLGVAIVYGGTAAVIGATAAIGIQILAEANQSGLINLGENATYILNSMSLITSAAIGNVAEFAMSACIMAEGMIGDDFLNSIQVNDESITNDFADEEWQIKLSSSSLVCGPKGSTYTVIVSSKASWVYEVPENQEVFCSVGKEDNCLMVSVPDYDIPQNRTNIIIIKSTNYREGLLPVTLRVTQNGILFELSENVLSFNEEGGEKGVFIDRNDFISRWEIVNPDWCKIDPGLESFFVKVDKTDKERNGVIRVIGYPKDFAPIERTIDVSQIPDNSWDGTSWYFREATYSTGHGIAVMPAYTMTIQNAKSGSFYITPQYNTWEPKTMTLLSSGQLYCTSSFSNATGDWYWTYLITRIGRNDISIKAEGTVDRSKIGSIKYSFGGYATGFRKH